MPTVLDVFSGDAFSCIEMTTAINKLPYVPSRLASLFPFEGVATTTVLLEEEAGLISLIPTKPRGSGQTTKRGATRRKARSFAVPHVPFDDDILADSIQNVRAFGSDNRLESITQVTNNKLSGLRQDHEITHEYHRIGAIQGHIKDADGATTIFNLFTEFGLTETVIDFELDDPLTDVKKKCSDVRRVIELKLGAVPFNGITCQCGDGFWDMLIAHDAVKQAYDRWNDGQFHREDQRLVSRFEFCGIVFENYRGKVGTIDFIANDTARFYPEGVPELFKHFGAPADFIEAVNTIGQPVYVKQERKPFDKGIDLHSQSNPLIVCRRPEVLIKGTTLVVPQ